ncbi:MAG: hypothetical protein IJY44_04230 [Bacteroidaceae bacterium]|nr:hypothetical protein [Bacteroidaceae bacterium]
MKGKYFEMTGYDPFGEFIRVKELKLRENRKRGNIKQLVKILSKVSSSGKKAGNPSRSPLFVHLCDKHKGVLYGFLARAAEEKFFKRS